MQTLQEQIELYTYGTKIHISICDLAGIFEIEEFKIHSRHQIHASAFCSVAKSTQLGLERCMRCRSMVIEWIRRKGCTLTGICPSGLYEVVVPVFQENKLICLVCVGNIICDQSASREKAENCCKKTGVDFEQIHQTFGQVQFENDVEIFQRMAEAIRDWLMEFMEKRGISFSHRRRWMVGEIMRQTELHYSTDISLAYFAKLYYYNEKYLGRIFRQEAKISFCRYLNRKRVEKAKILLKNEKLTITEISGLVGYSNVSYFNRVFRALENQSPSEYRAQ